MLRTATCFVCRAFSAATDIRISASIPKPIQNPFRVCGCCADADELPSANNAETMAVWSETLCMGPIFPMPRNELED